MNSLSGSQQWITTTYPFPSQHNSLHLFPQRRCFSILPPPKSLITERISVTELEEDDVLHDFFKERELNGDLITKVSDRLWLREVIDFVDVENGLSTNDTQLLDKPSVDEGEGGFLKLTKTSEWLLGDNNAPVNSKVVNQELQNNKERKKRLNLLRYKALKKELLLLTVGIGFACSGYCLVTLSIQAAVSYATGVFFRIGIRSQDLEDSLDKFIKGSSLALSSPRLVIPAVIYLLWGISQHFTKDFFDFQLVPAMVGVFAYKAAALVQVYRDNEDLQLIFPENEVKSVKDSHVAVGSFIYSHPSCDILAALSDNGITRGGDKQTIRKNPSFVTSGVLNR